MKYTECERAESRPQTHSVCVLLLAPFQMISREQFAHCVGWLDACLLAEHSGNMQSTSQGQICYGNGTFHHTEKEAADQTCCLTQHSIMELGQPVLRLTLYGQAASWAAIRAFKSQVQFDKGKPRKL